MLQSIDINFGLHANTVPEKIDGMEVVHFDNLSFVDSRLSCDTFNVIHVQNGVMITKQELADSVDYFKKRNLDYCLWVNNENLTDNLRSYFSELQLTEQNAEVGMALDLKSYTPIISDLHSHILQVDNVQKLGDYGRIIAANWSPPDVNILSYYEIAAEQYLKGDAGIILLIYYDGIQPKATVELFPSDDDTIGIYGLATLEDARGKGIGSALMTMALNVSRKLNYKQVVLQASEDGIGIYKKLGFRQYGIYYEYA